MEPTGIEPMTSHDLMLINLPSHFITELKIHHLYGCSLGKLRTRRKPVRERTNEASAFSSFSRPQNCTMWSPGKHGGLTGKKND